MSLAHQTRGISAITHTERSRFEFSELSPTDPYHEAVWDFLGSPDSWGIRSMHQLLPPRNLPLKSLSPSSNIPRATLNTVTWDPRILGSVQAIIRHSRSTHHNLVNPNDYRSSRPNTIDLCGQISWCTISNLISWLEIIYHKLGLECLFCHCERRILSRDRKVTVL